MKRNGLPLTFLFFIGLFTHLVAQQASDVKFDHLTIEEGLSQSIVNAIAQDKYGFIWIGTEDGLNRYDGLNVEVFQANPHDYDSTSIADSWITAIYLSSDKKLWFCTKNGLSYYHHDTENFVTYRHDPQDSTTIASNSLLSICEYENDLWIGTSDAGISRYNKNTQTFTHYRHNENDVRSLPGNQVNALLVDHANALWIGTDKGLAKYDPVKNHFISYREGENYRYRLPSDEIRSLYQSGDDILWVGTGGGGMSRFNKKQTRIINYMKRDNIHEMMKKAGINVIKEDSRGHFWVGTSQGILMKAQGVSERNFTVVKNSLSDPKSLTSNDISTIFEDSSGLIWIGTKGGGVNIFNSRQKKFEHYKHDYQNPNSLSKNVVQAIFEESKSVVWLGLREGGLNRFNRSTGEFRRYSNQPTKRDSLWAKTVTSIYKDHRGILWVGSANQGLNKHLKNKKRRRRYRRRNKGDNKIWEHVQHNSKIPYSISSNQIRHIFEDSDKDLWIATANGINLLSNLDSNKFIRYVHDPENPASLSDNDIASQAFFQDKNGSIWIGTANGVLNQFDKFTETFTHFKHDPLNPESTLPNKPILSLCEQNHYIWVGTNGGGLARFNKNTKQVKVYTKEDGLSNQVIYGIKIDDAGHLWISTKRGLARFSPEEELFHNYYAYHGLQSNVFSEGAAHQGKYSKELFFGGINGLNVFQPQDIQANSFIPPVYITNFTINNKPVAIQPQPQEGVHVHLTKSILNTKQLTLTHLDKYIAFKFVALNYSNPSKNRYKYQLIPFDEGWQEVKSNYLEASYNNLSPGSYTFQVMAANNDGIWNETPTEIQITVIPPWWEKTSSRIIAGILLAGLIYLFYRFRVRMLKQQKKNLQHQVNLRTAEVEERNIQMAAQQKKILKQNKDIQASIQYAQRIQTAILPIPKNIHKLLGEHFILFKPRNVVSGDFYWMTEQFGKIIVAVVDCTGHGVPGAFMSVIGASLLREIVEVSGITEPSTILEKMNQGVQQALKQKEYKTRDGMDIGLLVIEKTPDDRTKISYAGAHHPLMYIQEGEMFVLKGTRQAVGGYGPKPLPYATQSLIIKQPTTLYMASDGYQDQFGGPKDKKILKKNLKKILLGINQMPMEEQKNYLENYFANWKSNGLQTDDVLVMGFRLA